MLVWPFSAACSLSCIPGASFVDALLAIRLGCLPGDLVMFCATTAASGPSTPNPWGCEQMAPHYDAFHLHFACALQHLLDDATQRPQLDVVLLQMASFCMICCMLPLQQVGYI